MLTLHTFYKSKEWEKLRREILLTRLDEHGEVICEHCGKPIHKRYDAICHHKIPLTEGNVNDWGVSLAPDNIGVVHHACHNAIHERFGSWQRHIWIVYGAPCAGKSSYVRANASRHDIIVDVDELYSAISCNPLHDKSNRLTSNVLQLRDSLLDMIRTRNGKWVNAWIVTSKCIPNELERMATSLGAEIVHIDTDEATCMERAKQREYGENEKFVREYFANYKRFEKLLTKLDGYALPPR